MQLGRIFTIRAEYESAEHLLRLLLAECYLMGLPASAYEVALHLADCLVDQESVDEAFDVLDVAVARNNEDVSLFAGAEARLRLESRRAAAGLMWPPISSHKVLLRHATGHWNRRLPTADLGVPPRNRRAADQRRPLRGDRCTVQSAVNVRRHDRRVLTQWQISEEQWVAVAAVVLSLDDGVATDDTGIGHQAPGCVDWMDDQRRARFVQGFAATAAGTLRQLLTADG